MSLALALLHGLVEVLGEEGGAAIEEGSQRSHQCADEADGNDTLDTGRQDVLHHHGEGTVGRLVVGDVHLDAALRILRQSECNHARDEEHEAGQDFEEAGSDGTTACASHHLSVVLARHLSEHTLNDVLVSTPVPEADDGGSEEHHIARELRIHRVAWVGM